jgi:hypothetical protein
MYKTFILSWNTWPIILILLCRFSTIHEFTRVTLIYATLLQRPLHLMWGKILCWFYYFINCICAYYFLYAYAYFIICFAYLHNNILKMSCKCQDLHIDAYIVSNWQTLLFCNVSISLFNEIQDYYIVCSNWYIFIYTSTFDIFKLELSFFVPFAYVILTCVFAGSWYDIDKK